MLISCEVWGWVTPLAGTLTKDYYISVGLGISRNLHFPLDMAKLNRCIPHRAFFTWSWQSWQGKVYFDRDLQPKNDIAGTRWGRTSQYLHEHLARIENSFSFLIFSFSTPNHQPLTLTPRWLAGESPLSVGDTSSFIVVFLLSFVSFRRCNF